MYHPIRGTTRTTKIRTPNLSTIPIKTTRTTITSTITTHLTQINPTLPITQTTRITSQILTASITLNTSKVYGGHDGELLSSQQNMRNELQSNNEVVQGMQSAQKEHKANMDMMNKQLSQLANSMSEMKGKSGTLPSTVHIPGKANVSKIMLRSGTSYKGPEMKSSVEEPSTRVYSKGFSPQGRESEQCGDEFLREGVEVPNPQVTEPVQIKEKSCEIEKEGEQLPARNGNDKTESVTEPPTGAEGENSEEVTKIPRKVAKGEKSFPYRFVTKERKRTSWIIRPYSGSWMLPYLSSRL